MASQKQKEADLDRKASVLKDHPTNEQSLDETEVTIDLPEVSDIPGQENVEVPVMDMFRDSTVASDGEEGTAVFDENDDEEL